MELFWLEHKKLWRKKIVKICVLLCFVYYVILEAYFRFNGSVLAVQMTIQVLLAIILMDIQ